MAGEDYSYAWVIRCLVAETAEAEAAVERQELARQAAGTPGGIKNVRKFDMDAAMAARKKRKERQSTG